MTTNPIVSFIWLPAVAYLLGSIPWGVLLTRVFTSVDIRQQGSRNIGMTNVSRVAGSTLGLLTFVGDVLKGAVPVYLSLILAGKQQGTAELLAVAAALAAFFGHLFPLYMKFKGGGKGVATCAGCFAILAPPACLSALLIFILMLFSTKRVSAASLAAAAILPWAAWFSAGTSYITASAVLMAIFIFWRHADNIKRLISGTEPKLGKKL
ncbi:Acyl-phosphate:glycerol-3-phosphate O-acyltransferase PlsY (EC [Olavius algarvensis Delta 1 endosymbiont]|nr:Acyl-phosphate:glycerol-3-phosphate O-acyltransferase PlsY (EC [Olavius algarvensis Delta 1 endosymbiont]